VYANKKMYRLEAVETPYHLDSDLYITYA